MLLTVERPIVEAVWAALDPAPHTGPPIGMRSRLALPEILRDAGRAGWVNVMEAETVIRAADLDIPIHDTESALAAFGVPQHFVFPRPRARTTAAWGVPMIAAVDLACLMILLERAGLNVDPAPLCEALAPGLRSKAYLTGPELKVHWHASERHRSEALEIGGGPGLTRGRPAQEVRTGTGYRAALFRGDGGASEAIRVEAPRRIRRSLAA